MKELAIVTVFFNYPEDRMPIFLDNALKYYNEEDVYIARFNGLPEDASYYEKLCAYKIDYLLPYLKEHIQGKYRYVLFMDALDVNFYRDPKTLIEDFHTFGKSIVFCGEKELWPINSYTHLYNTKQAYGPAQFLNSGLYLGVTDSVVSHLEDIVHQNYPERVTDQSIWSIQYLVKEDIGVDQNYKLFFSTHKAKEYVNLESDKVALKEINPYFVHDNGPYGEDTVKLTHLL